MLLFSCDGPFHVGVFREVSLDSKYQDTAHGRQRIGTIYHGTDMVWHFDALGNVGNGVSPTFTIDEMRGVLDMMSTLAQVGQFGHPIKPSK